MGEPYQNPSSADQPSFEQALAELEQIVHDLEDGRLGLAEALARYEAGVKLLQQCFALLEHAERRIELLTGVDAAGNPITKPFDDKATLAAGQEEGLPRPRRGGKSPKKSAAEPKSAQPSPPAMDEPGSLF